MKSLRWLLLALTLAGPVAAGGVGWNPGSVTTAVGPSVVSVRIGTGLQTICDGLTNGGVILLGSGTYYGDPTSPTDSLVLRYPNIQIVGVGQNPTVIASPVLIEIGGCGLHDLTVCPPGAMYGVKLYRGLDRYPAGGGVSRCVLERVFIGAADTSSRNASLGPAKGLWLDSAILTRCEQCVFAFCRESGVYQHTTSGTWSTNCNKWEGCSSNFNSRYGYEFAGGGMLGTEVSGGNIENNTFGAVSATACTNLTLRGIDFEDGTYPCVSRVSIATSSPVLIEDCNFVTSVDTRAFIFSTCVNATVTNCRFAGYPAQTSVGIINENSFDGRDFGNTYADSATFIVNRGGMTAVRFGQPIQPRLSDFNGNLWLPSTAGTGDQGLGTLWTVAGTVSQATPTGTDLSTQARRTIFTTTGASTTCGVSLVGASDFQYWKGNFAGGGGFYFAASFQLETWAANTAALFVGLASSAAGHVCTASSDSSTIAGDVIGLYHSPGDVVNILRVVARNNVTTQKPAFTNANGGPVLASGQGFRFEMWNFPYSTRTHCRLTSINSGLLVGYGEATTNGPRTSAFLAPQVEIENNAAGACALGISNVYVSR